MITAVVLAGDSMTASERAQDNYNRKIEENSKLVKDEKDEIDKLIGTLEDGLLCEQNIAFNDISYYFQEYKTEKRTYRPSYRGKTKGKFRDEAKNSVVRTKVLQQKVRQRSNRLRK